MYHTAWSLSVSLFVDPLCQSSSSTFYPQTNHTPIHSHTPIHRSPARFPPSDPIQVNTKAQSTVCLQNKAICTPLMLSHIAVFCSVAISTCSVFMFCSYSVLEFMLFPIRNLKTTQMLHICIYLCINRIFCPVTAQAPSSAIPAQAGVGVATTVHLNPMQLMAVDRIGLQSAQISTQNIQPASMTAQGIQPAPIGVQGLHATAPISTQGIQQAPVATQQPQPEAKPSGNNKQVTNFISLLFYFQKLCCDKLLLLLSSRCSSGWEHCVCDQPNWQYVQRYTACHHCSSDTPPGDEHRCTHTSLVTQTQHPPQETCEWGVSGLCSNQ